MNVSITDIIIDFLLNQKAPHRKARLKAIEHIKDGIAVMLAGSRTVCTRKVYDYIMDNNRAEDSSILGFDRKTSPSSAALINGTSGHADDFDDTQLSTSPDRIYGLLTHPTVPVLAAALAVAEKMECSGLELIDAFIIGFEVECKLAETIKPDHYRRGFHSTGTMGVFGACASSGILMQLDEEQLRFSLGIAASMSSGIRVNFGTMTKPLHAGMAASNGIMACMLGKRGFTADKHALDGKWGYMNILGGGAEPEKIQSKLGNPYSIITPGATIKMYPCGSLGQPTMDALLKVVKEYDLSFKDVKRITVRAGPNILEPLRYTTPETELQAKFSLQFGLATLLLKRKAGLREYTDDWVRDPNLRRTMRKVETLLDDEISRMGVDKMRSKLEVELVNGEKIQKIVDTARGTPENPFTSWEIDEKFMDCAGFVLNKGRTIEAINVINNLEMAKSVKELTSILA